LGARGSPEVENQEAMTHYSPDLRWHLVGKQSQKVVGALPMDGDSWAGEKPLAFHLSVQKTSEMGCTNAVTSSTM